jgi:hypothetical protein
MLPATWVQRVIWVKHDEVKKSRAKGRLRGKKCSSVLVLGALATVGKPNVRACGGGISFSLW